MARLLAAPGGLIAAGAGVDLGGGFVSGRLAGARGDRRDAVLVALRVLGLDGLPRLGERAGVLTALFGVEATKRVAAAANRAIADGRWAALQLASAASALLGAEQLERVLALGTAPDPAATATPDVTPGHAADVTPRPPAGAALDRPADGTPGHAAGGAERAVEVAPEPHAMPSALAAHLQQLLAPLPRHRRLAPLLDLWRQVAARQEAARRTARRLATQGRQSRLEELARRRDAHEDAIIVEQVRRDLGRVPSLADAARWTPHPWHWTNRMMRAMHDAMAATVLLRTAAAVADHGVREGLARSAAQLRAAAALMDAAEAGAAARRVPGLAGLPARPGCYVRDLARRLDAPNEQYVRQRLARAADYAGVALDAVSEVIIEAGDALAAWSSTGMRAWRDAVGYTAERPPSEWLQPPVPSGDPPVLAERATERPPQEVETAGDLLWYGELGDALARLHGHERAEIGFQHPYPYVDHLPEPDTGLVPRLDTISSALAGAAQLVSLGARPSSRHCASWHDLTDALVKGVEAMYAPSGGFLLPGPLAAVDGTTIPGTELRVECAREPRALARWSSYMGNCIASPYYVEDATKGLCALLALRGPDGAIVANAEIRRRGRREGWQVAELRARFNADLDAERAQRLRDWVATLPPEPVALPEQDALPPAEPPARERAPGRKASHRAGRAFDELHGVLADLAERELSRPAAVAALDTLRVLDTLRGPDGSRRPRGAARRDRSATAGHAAPPAGDRQTAGGEVATPAGDRHTAGGGVTTPAGDRHHAGGGVTTPADDRHHAGGGVTTPARDHRSAGGRDVLVALRRLPSPGRLDRACLAALPVTGLPVLWQATGVRPLARALDALDPELRARHDQLGLLLSDAPLPGSLRKLSRHGAIASARSMELVGRRVRAALGRLARDADPVLARQVARDPGRDVLCALVVAVTCWDVSEPTVPVTGPGESAVPGYPRSDLEDPAGPWRRALAGAGELGADVDAFRDRVAAGGLRVPAAWLGTGGWPALWQRACRATTTTTTTTTTPAGHRAS
ncbi:hypothetical protein MF672_000625 [Actinomadura sp. ATCC 31491]|uniref:Secreted protein n=1 Tax=Actinomadura luzonensis TaxID=2805427 RepID=A0ABT0FK32_9ACTN|nr:hypothetical protein [Actinomadura luzonensis]MCK2212308.1 hypothetical protein [Actinomadura luzonensis]